MSDRTIRVNGDAMTQEQRELVEAVAEETATRVAEKLAPTTSPVWLTDEQATRRLGLAPGTLKQWRFEGRGPPWVKRGRIIRYEAAACDAWLRAGAECAYG